LRCFNRWRILASKVTICDFKESEDLIDKLLVGANEIKAGKAEGKEENT